MKTYIKLTPGITFALSLLVTPTMLPMSANVIEKSKSVSLSHTLSTRNLIIAGSVLAAGIGIIVYRRYKAKKSPSSQPPTSSAAPAPAASAAVVAFTAPQSLPYWPFFSLRIGDKNYMKVAGEDIFYTYETTHTPDSGSSEPYQIKATFYRIAGEPGAAVATPIATTQEYTYVRKPSEDSWTLES